MSRTLLIDNGLYLIKIGYAGTSPQIVLNLIVRTKDKRLILGRLIDKNQNISGCTFKRPYEKGQLMSWETEKLIWDYCFNSLDLGLHVEENDPNDMNLILTHSPFTLPKITKNTDQIIFEEYGFHLYYKNIPAAFIPFNYKDTEKLYGALEQKMPENKPYKDYELVIDSGFDATYIIPMVYGHVYWDGVRKLDIGGRFLTGFLRELISFRYYDVTDETILVNNIKEQTCFVPENYMKSLEKLKMEKELLSRGKVQVLDSSMIVDYVLPDYKTTTTGYLLTNEKRAQQKNSLDELQIMKLYDERFSIPETLFDPAIAGIKHRNGLIKTICDSINACPELVRPMLASNIVCVGGTFKCPGFEPRLQAELKLVLPVEWDIRIAVAERPDVYCWESMDVMSRGDVYKTVRIEKSEYFEKGWGYLNERFGCRLSGW